MQKQDSHFNPIGSKKIQMLFECDPLFCDGYYI